MTAHPPLREILSGPRGQLLIALLITEFAASVSGLSYAAVLPVAVAELGGLSLYGLAVTISGVIGIAVMPVGAYLYAKVGPHGQLWLATAVFLVGVAVTVTAQSMVMLLLGLALRGLAGGFMAGLGLGVLSSLYDDARHRERAFGLFALMWVVPSLVAPLVNSALLLAFDWRVAMAWPAIVLLIGRILVSHALSRVELERTDAPARVRGIGWFIGIAVGLAAALALLSVDSAAPIVAGVAVLVLVLALPFRRALVAMLPVQRRAVAGGWALALICASYFGMGAVVPLIAAVFIDGTGVLGAVLVAIAPISWAALSAGGVGARMTAHRAYLIAAFAFPLSGLLVAAAAFVASADDAAVAVALLTAASLLQGVGMGLTYPKVMAESFVGFEVDADVSPAHGGVVLGLSEDVGTVAGAAVLAGIGGVLVGVGAGWVAGLAVASALMIAALMTISRNNPVWSRRHGGGSARADSDV